MSLIVISKDPAFIQTLQQEFRETIRTIFCHPTLADARPHLADGWFDCCIVDADPDLRRAAEDLRLLGPARTNCRWIAVASSPSPAEIERAQQHGFSAVLPKPLQPQLLKPFLQPPPSHSAPMNFQPPARPRQATGPEKPDLEIIRRFSRILSHSQNLSELVHHFILKVREIVGVNRIAVFLEHPKSAAVSSALQHRLRHISSIGIPAETREILDLSRHNGIGGWVTRSGQILRAEQAPSLLAPAELARAQREFTILGCEIAIPIADRERTIGVALLGGHLTRIGFSDEELQLMFHLMEELGLSIKNNWLHQELAENHRLFHDVLASMKNGSLVVGPELEILHANPAMIRFVRDESADDSPLAFAELPPAIAERVYNAVERGIFDDPFFFSEKSKNHRACRITILPFRGQTRLLPQSVMLLMEDLTEIENARQLASEVENAKLSTEMARRLAHEIRQSVAPVTSHLQRLKQQYEEPVFRASLEETLRTEISRISRLASQMAFLTDPPPSPAIMTGLEKLLRESFDRAQTHAGIRGILTLHNRSGDGNIRCHPPSLSQAFQEIFQNALQAHAEPQLSVTVSRESVSRRETICIDFADNGDGFSEKTAARAFEPFFTLRETSIGLGLTVAKRIAQDHGGWIELVPRSAENRSDLRFYLPQPTQDFNL